MNSNYAFAFRKPLNAAPVAAPPVMSRAPPTRAPAPVVTNANRFSMNRAMNHKMSGGCRSCN